MADKSFEQQVKNELSELRMKPAASVWTGVEDALHHERKRRWLLWLFLVAGIGAASFCGYYYFNNDKQETAGTPVKIQSLPKEESKQIAKANEAPVVSETQALKKNGPSTNTVIVPSEKIEHKPNVFSANRKMPAGNKTNQDVLADRNVQSKPVVKPKEENTEAYKAPKTTGETGIEKTTENGVVNNAETGIKKQSSETEQASPIKEPITLSSKTDEKAAETIPATPAASGNESPVAATVVNTKKNKWQWNISVDAGSGGLRDAIKLPTVGFGRLSAASATPGNGNPAPLLTVEPAVKDAFSFSIQLQATKQLGKKHRFGFSAGYSLFQTSMNVGRKIDSSAFFNNTSSAFYSGLYSSSFYYTNTDSIAYTNKYHFLRLGADLYTPFRLFRKIPLQWQLGAGINILAATNGLHYDPVTKKIFSNNALFAKTQFYMSTGIDVSIGKVPFLYIGPHWQYSFTNMTSKPGDDQHMFLSSVKVSFVLPKKKK
jgi:hypothetical protein